MINCRSCGRKISTAPLLAYEAMPAVAQHLPDSPGTGGAVDFKVCQCEYCGLIQLDSPPVPYFREVIRAAAVSPEMRDFRLGQFKDFLSRYGLTGKKILECGCGGGEFLELMQQAGADAYGMEFGEKNLCKCREKSLNVEKCFFENGSEKLSNAPFDGFFILNYLEHLPDITVYLEGIRNNLADGAVGLIEVPNFDMMLQNSTFAEFTTDHLYYFTAASLKTLLENNGFEVISENVVWYGYILSFEVRKRQLPDLSKFDLAKAELTGKLQDLVNFYGKERSAVWGASHQAFAVLALAGLHEKIRCIIDSASFKQGKFSPATDIPVVSPESIASEDLDLLIVIAGGYSDEVAKIARKKFGKQLVICILRENKLELL